MKYEAESGSFAVAYMSTDEYKANIQNTGGSPYDARRKDFAGIIRGLLSTYDKADSTIRLAEGLEIKLYSTPFYSGATDGNIFIEVPIVFKGEDAPRSVTIQIGEAMDIITVMSFLPSDVECQLTDGEGSANSELSLETFEQALAHVETFYDVTGCNPYADFACELWEKLRGNPSESASISPEAIIGEKADAAKGHGDVAGQMGLLQKNLRENQSLLEKNPNGNVKIILHTKNRNIQFDSIIDCLSSTIQNRHPDYVFTNNISVYEDMKIYNLWVRATPTDLIHQPLDESDYEAACLSTGLTASTMLSLQENLVLGSLHGNKERWGLLKFKTMGIEEDGTFELIYTTQDGSGTGVDALEKAAEILPLAISILTKEDSSISVKSTNLDELSKRVSNFQLVHENGKQNLSAISNLRKQLVAKLGEMVEATRKGIKTEAEKLGLFSFTKKKKLLQADEMLMTKYKAFVSNQQDANVAPQAWESVVNALEETGNADKDKLDQLSNTYKKASGLQECYEEVERQSAQRLQAAKGGVAYLQTISIA